MTTRSVRIGHGLGHGICGAMAGPYYVSSGAPLGSFEKISSYLTGKMRMARRAVEEIDLPGAAGLERTCEYLGYMKTVANWGKDTERQVYLLVDGAADIAHRQ